MARKQTLLRLCSCSILVIVTSAGSDHPSHDVTWLNQLPLSQWNHLSTQDGISSYETEVAGRYPDGRSSDTKAYRAEAKLDLHISEIMSVFMDNDMNRHWVENEVEMDEKPAAHPSEVISYSVFSSPWPISPREFVTVRRTDIDRPNCNLVMFSKSVDDDQWPRTASRVRAQTHGFWWNFTCVPDKDETEVRVIGHGDPMGTMPKWAVNMFQQTFAIKSIGRLSRAVKQLKLPRAPAFMDWGHSQAVMEVNLNDSRPTPARYGGISMPSFNSVGRRSAVRVSTRGLLGELVKGVSLG